jgi:hypothetical protein
MSETSHTHTHIYIYTYTHTHAHIHTRMQSTCASAMPCKKVTLLGTSRAFSSIMWDARLTKLGSRRPGLWQTQVCMRVAACVGMLFVQKNI